MQLRSIRVRLTLWYLIVLALILALFAAGIYVSMRRSLHEQLDDTVENRARLIEPLVTLDRAGAPSLDLGRDVPDSELDDEFQRLFDVSGDLVFENSQRSREVSVDPEALEQAFGGETHIGTREDGVRIFTMPVVRDGEPIAVLQSAQATDDLRETLRGLRLILLAGIPGAIVLASAGGWWLASRALSPIDDITRAAQQITAQDLSRRLNADLPDDEVGRLARTFDGMIARLDASFQRQRQFTADASHELRTPLTAIRGQIDVALARPRDAAEYQRVLATVNAQVDRMTRLSTDLLMLARADAGSMPLHREEVDVRQLVEGAAEQVRPLATEKRLELRVEPSADASVSADPDMLLQLLINLLDNAIKYTERGWVTVGWRAEPGRLLILVRDTGTGIPAEHRERIFERFHRVDSGRARQDGGAGLGLAICRSIVEAHRGTIAVESSAAGSAFKISLPA